MTHQSWPVIAAEYGLMDPPPPEPAGLFDLIRARILGGGDIAAAVDGLSLHLSRMRGAAPWAEWLDIIALARAHPLMGLMRENPFLRRSFLKPLGYAGDPGLTGMLDPGPLPSGTSPLGVALLERDRAGPLAAALRRRRDFMAAQIDRAAGRTAGPVILAAGGGYLGEAGMSQAFRDGRAGRLTALDHDAGTLRTVARTFAGTRVETVNRGIDAAMNGTFAPESFDLIYVSGVYETISQCFARGLTRAFFDLLKPGGRLVMSNLVEDTGAAYLEAFGDWFIEYRDNAALLDLALAAGGGPRTLPRQSPGIRYLEVDKPL